MALVAEVGEEIGQRVAGAGDVPRLQLVEPHRVRVDADAADDRRHDERKDQDPTIPRSGRPRVAPARATAAAGAGERVEMAVTVG